MEIVAFPRVRAWRFRATLRQARRSRLWTSCLSLRAKTSCLEAINPETEEAIARFVSGGRNAIARKRLRGSNKSSVTCKTLSTPIEEGKLWILQTRSAKRTPQAALRFAIAFVKEGLITPSQALRRLNGLDLNALARKRLVDVHEPVARGTGASAGIAVGRRGL